MPSYITFLLHTGMSKRRILGKKKNCFNTLSLIILIGLPKTLKQVIYLSNNTCIRKIDIILWIPQHSITSWVLLFVNSVGHKTLFAVMIHIIQNLDKLSGYGLAALQNSHLLYSLRRRIASSLPFQRHIPNFP